MGAACWAKRAPLQGAELHEMIMRSQFIMHEGSGGGAGLAGHRAFVPRGDCGSTLLVIISERKEANKIYLPDSNQRPLGRPLSVLHRTQNVTPENAFDELLRIRL